MSNQFTLPNLPIIQPASPRDLSGIVADVPFLGVYQYDATQRFVYGTRFLAWDGRVWKYCYATSAQYSYSASGSVTAAPLSWTVNPVAGSAGDMFAVATVSGRSVDDLAGGYFMMYDASNTQTTMLFGIVGNDATSGSTTRLYLDSPLPVASTTSDYHEIFPNIWAGATSGYSTSPLEYSFIIGVPAVSCSATYKFWCQTWGPAYITPGQSVDSPAAHTRLLRFSGNGALYTEATVANGQIAGSIYNYGNSSIAGPVVYLMCST